MGSNNNVKALKSGVWYTFANFITKGLVFIITPIIARILTHADYGLYSNYASWLSTFTIFATLNLGASFISARFDFYNDFDSYVSSVLVLSSVVTAIWAIFINIFPVFFSSITGVEINYLNIMIIYLFMFVAVDLFQSRERYYYHYKSSVAVSIIISVVTAALSIILVVYLENKLSGWITGSSIPTVIVGLILYIVIVVQGKKVNIKYWKYAIPICIPYIPHLLSLTLLNSMDKIMITKICGAEDNALYSLAYSCGAAITVLVVSLNTAFSTWLGEKLHNNEYDEIRKVSKYYILMFVYVACGVMLLTPELLLLMGGNSYSDAIYVLPPVAFGCVCQFLYTMYVNVEQFKKKTVGMAFASVIAALSNYGLNSLLIPRFGYLVAAYTTLISYALLLFIHMFLVKRINLLKVYSTNTVFFVLLFMCCYTLLINLVLKNNTIRYSMLIVYALVSVMLMIRYRSVLVKLLKNWRRTNRSNNV